MMPKPISPLTESQLSTYHDGKLFQSFWSKLNQKQQKWLIDLSVGKIKNHANNLDDMQDENQN